MKQLKKRIIMVSVMMAGIIFAGIPVFIEDRTNATVYAFAAIGGVIAFAGLIWGMIKIRCPHCHGGLPLRDWFIEYCPRCGEKIDQG